MIARVLVALALATGGVAAILDAGAPIWLAAIPVAAALCFVTWSRLAGAAALFALSGWAWWVEPEVHHVKLLPAAAAIAWAVAERWRGREAGPEAACGVVAAAYTSSAISKLVVSGASWFSGTGLAVLVAERGHDTIGRSVELCALLATGALIVEASGALFVWRRARLPFAIAAVALHAGIGVLMGYLYLPWMLLVVGLALTSRS